MSAATVTVRVIGAGRAGRSFAKAIDDLVEWDVIDMRGRGVAIDDAAADVDLVVIATPDAVVADVAAAIRPGRAVVAHVAGSLGLDVLAPHDRRAALHPLMSLPDAEIGAERLTGAGSPSPVIRWSPTSPLHSGPHVRDRRRRPCALSRRGGSRIEPPGGPSWARPTSRGVGGGAGRCAPGARPRECGERRGPRPCCGADRPRCSG